MRIPSKLLLLAAAFLAFAGTLRAQGQGEIYGTVSTLDKGIKVPVDYAVVLLRNAGVYTTTDAKGNYSLKGLDPGTYELVIQLIGYENVAEKVTVKGRVRKDYVLTESTFRLEEVHVVAEASKAGEATASRISRQAIDHSQTSSLRLSYTSSLPSIQTVRRSIAG